MVCRRVLWVPDLWGQYSEKIRFIEKRRVQDEGGRHVAKNSSDPRQAYPEVKLQGRDLVRVVGIVAPFPHWGSEPEENSFYRTTGRIGHRRRVPGSPSSGTPRVSQANFRVGTVRG